MIQDTREEKKFAIKKEFRADFKKMYLLCNKKVENKNRRLKTISDKNLSFDYNFETKTSHITNFNVNGEDENLESDIDSDKSGFTQNVHINEIPRNIVYKALHTLCSDYNSYYNFENLRKRFNVDSTEDFLQFISPVPINLTFTDNRTLENEEPVELLEMTKQFFLYAERELEKYDHPFKATDFSLVPFEDCFPFETTRMIDTNSKDFAENHQFEAKCKNYSWYALDSFYGTSEERALVDFIYNHFQNLNEKYDKICLLRNEEVYKIFDFETGEGFQPDFLLLLQSNDGKNDYLQVFIEPKGEHLKGEDNDAWKEKFLLEISHRYGFSKPFVQKSENYVLFGLPFFNESDNEMKNKFDESFAKTLEIKTEEVNYDIEEKVLNVAEKM